MRVFKEISRDTFWPYKGEAIIFTSKGNKEALLKIIRDIAPGEFDAYGLNEDKEFCIPIYEELEELNEGAFYLNKKSNHSFWDGYYGKFELDLEKLYQVCDEKQIPVLVETMNQENC